VPNGGKFNDGNGFIEGDSMGHTLGEQIGAISILLEQKGWFIPFMQAQ